MTASPIQFAPLTIMRLIWFDSGRISEAGLLPMAVENSTRRERRNTEKDLGAHAGSVRHLFLHKFFETFELIIQTEHLQEET